jgi:tetratricopeptide (TPR) repeat protein
VLPLNWEHPDAHAIYWAALGLQRASGKEYSIDELNTDRIVFHSIQNLYRRGKMIVYTSRIPAENDPCNIIERESVFLFPDLRMFDRYDQALRALTGKYAELEGNVESLQNAHRNMLKHAILLFYQAGHMDKAIEIYNTLRKEYPQDTDVHVSLAEYVRTRFINELASIGINDAAEIITLMLQETYYRYAVHDDDEAFGREKMAREVYDHYQKQYEGEGTDRVVLPDFNVLRYVGISSFLNDMRYPDFIRRDLIERIRVERPELYEKLNQQHEYFMQEMEKQESTQQ